MGKVRPPAGFASRLDVGARELRVLPSLLPEQLDECSCRLGSLGAIWDMLGLRSLLDVQDVRGPRDMSLELRAGVSPKTGVGGK